MSHCTVDLVEHSNYSPSLQLQAGVRFRVTTAALKALCSFPTSDTYCWSSICSVNVCHTFRLNWLRADHQQCQCVHHLGCRKHMETGEDTYYCNNVLLLKLKSKLYSPHFFNIIIINHFSYCVYLSSCFI